jgi:hypothetical protein
MKQKIPDTTAEVEEESAPSEACCKKIPKNMKPIPLMAIPVLPPLPPIPVLKPTKLKSKKLNTKKQNTKPTSPTSTIISTTRKNKLPEIELFKSNYLSCFTINDPIKTRILVDTGAENGNIISLSYFQKLQKLYPDLVLQEDNSIITSFKSKQKNYGNIKLPIKLAYGFHLNESFSKNQFIKFICIDTLENYDIILGLPAIHQLQMRLDFMEGAITILDRKIHLTVNNPYIKTIDVRAIQRTILKPGRETHIPVKIESDEIFKNAPDYYHKIIPSKVVQDTKCLKMPSAVARNQIEFVSIANLSERPIKIKSNALLAYIVAANPTADTHMVDLASIMTQEDTEDDDEMLEKIYLPQRLMSKNGQMMTSRNI